VRFHDAAMAISVYKSASILHDIIFDQMHFNQHPADWKTVNTHVDMQDCERVHVGCARWHLHKYNLMCELILFTKHLSFIQNTQRHYLHVSLLTAAITGDKE